MLNRPVPALRAAMAAALMLAATSPAWADLERVKRDVYTLADEKYSGRMTGSEGERLAAEYIIGELEKIGAQPLPELGGWRHKWEYAKGVSPAANANGLTLLLPAPPSGLGKQVVELNKGFRPMSLSSNGTAEAEVVFAGYGLKVAGDEGKTIYDSYAGLDVKDKIVLVLRYAPEKAPNRDDLMLAATFQRKQAAAKEAGAKGLILVTGPNSNNAGELVDMGGEQSRRDGIPMVSVSADVAGALLKAAGKTLAEVQTELDSGDARTGFALGGVKAKLEVKLERERVDAFNIAAVLPATAPGADKEYIAMGAHYDHLGNGKFGGSLGRVGEIGKIHYGADDNGSGTAATLEAARMIVADPTPRRRPILVTFWTGEEMGLLGSEAFCAKMPVGDHKVASYLNMDMVGRMKKTDLMVQGVGSSEGWKPVIEEARKGLDLNLVYQENPWQPSDIQSFVEKSVPSVMFFTGLHEDYHRPTDTPEKIQYAGLHATTTLAARTMVALAAAEKPLVWKEFQRPSRGMFGMRGRPRVIIGVMPDYDSEIKEGIPIRRVTPGGPSEKAGMKDGDVVMKVAGQSIGSITDWTTVLQSIKAGEPVDIVVLRDGKELSLKVTPERSR